MNWAFWTEDEERYLSENYRDTFNTDLAFKLGKSVGAIEMKAYRMGLSKGDDFIHRHMEGFKLKNGHHGFFKKGNPFGNRFSSENQPSKELIDKRSNSIREKFKREKIRQAYGLPRLTKWNLK